MPRELTNAQITHVSYVDKGANQKRFFLTKSAEEVAPVINKEVKIVTKADDTQQLVYGVVYEPEIEDSHGDFMTAQEIEKAAHGFLKDARNIDTQHDFEAGVGEVVESYVAPTDIEIGTETIAKGSWVLVTKASEEVWESIQKGEITGYSMAGTAEVTEVEKAEDGTMKKFFETMKSFFSGETVQKGAVKDTYEKVKTSKNLWNAFHVFEDYFYSEVWNETPDGNKLKEYAQDLADLLQEIASSPDILKALEPHKIAKEEIEMTKEEMSELLKSELAPLKEKVEALEKSAEDKQAEEVAKSEEVKKEEGSEKEDLIKSFQDILKAELAPLSDRIETVEKARGISKSADTDTAVQKSEDENVWAGLL